MLNLFYSPGTASLVVHWLLLELEVPHQLTRLDLEAGEHKRADYLRLNPGGVVPTLIVDGAPVTETTALVMHLADAHGGGTLAPPLTSLDRARYYQWICFCANTLQPAYRRWFYPHEAPGTVDEVKASARAAIEAAWTRVDAHLAAGGPYLLGDTLSAADFMLCMLMRWSRNMPKPAHTWTACGAHAARLKARPSFVELYAREGLTEWA